MLLSPRSTLILLGLSGAGKTSVAARLTRAARLDVAEIGALVRAEARAKHRTPLEHANYVFRHGSYNYFVARLLRKHPKHPLIIVGPRRPEEVAYLREQLGRCTVCSLEASFSVRSMRKHKIPASPVLRHRDAIELSWGFGRAKLAADIHIDSEQRIDLVTGEILDHWTSS